MAALPAQSRNNVWPSRGPDPKHERTAAEIAARRPPDLTLPEADQLIVEAIRVGAIPASRLPKVLEAWEKPRYEAFQARTAWALYNAFTELAKSTSPRAQVEDTLRLTRVFRAELELGG